MADDDNFDIDIYGDGEGMDDDSKAYIKEENEKREKTEQTPQPNPSATPTIKQDSRPPSTSATTVPSTKPNDSKREASEDSSAKSQPQQQQGTKRKGESDERRIDAGATNALMISDLHWWTTEDDIREWAADAGAEAEMNLITFSEHKVNGKSKGQAFIEFTSPQASTALKHKIDTLTTGVGGARKFSVVFTASTNNPFKTLPKDAPKAAKDDRAARAGSTPYSGGPTGPQQHEGGYRGNSGFRGRGGGGGYNGGGGGARGTYQNQNGYHQNRNFSGPMNGGNAAFNNNQGFQPNMGMMNNFAGGGFNNNRGGGGGMRGGGFNNNRGGRGGANNNMGNPMMNPMGMNMMMGMNPMVAGMGPQGFNGQFNPAMFGQGGNMNMNMNMNGGGDWGHGTKRQRQD